MSFVVALSSESSLKVSAVEQVLKEYSGGKLKLILIPTKDAPIPEQPINSGAKCVQMRMDYMKKKLKKSGTKYDLLVSIENGIEISKEERDSYLYDHIKNFKIQSIDDFCFVCMEDKQNFKIQSIDDFCFVCMEDKHGTYFGKSLVVLNYHADKYLNDIYRNTPMTYEYLELGTKVTVGEMITREFPHIDPKNWMDHSPFGYENNNPTSGREFQIIKALKITLHKIISKVILFDSVIKVQDFPKPGVLFQDLSDILIDPHLLSVVVDSLKDCADSLLENANLKDWILDSNTKVKVMGLDARGFIYGPLLAQKMEMGFIMARKKGKLPGKTVEVEYETEYSKACIEIMPHLINPGDKIIICDDLVASGGSLKAASDLVEKCGGIVIGCICVLHVPELIEQARAKLHPIPIKVVV